MILNVLLFYGSREPSQYLPSVRMPHADAAVLLRLSEVVVELVDVLGVWIEAAGCADASLEFDEGVEGCEVDGAAGSPGRAGFLRRCARVLRGR